MTTPLDAAPPGAAAAQAARRTPLVVVLLVAATFVVILNETIMVNAIPRLAADFDVSLRAAQWLSTIFLLTMAAVIPVTGWFLRQVTTRQAYALAMTVFCAGTAVCAAAPLFEVLLLGRVVQAAGTAVMMPLLMTTLMTVVPEADRGRVMGTVTLAMSCAPALGPAVSGLILGFGGWRLIFVAVLPVAALVTIGGLRQLVDVGEREPAAIDWTSVVLAAAGFATLVYGLSEIGGASAVVPAVCGGLGVLLVAAFVVRQLSLQRSGSPLLDLRALSHRTYTLSLLVMAVGFMAMLGAMILLPVYLQQVRGLSPLRTGLLVMPGGLAMGLLGPQVGKVFDRVGSRPVVVPGAVAILAALVVLARIEPTTPYAALLGAHVLMMVGLAAVFTPVFALGLGSLPPHLYSHGSSILGTLQQVAGAVGTAAVVVIADARTRGLMADGVAGVDAVVGGLRCAFLAGAGAAVLVVALAALLPARVSATEG
ncbi:DHA2 family efflux MFS transporter permease subunit [Nocardioides sp. TRM66260-LWL]|uniref:DHA2 family efflux MFS transporter permease subunit n=1 Tax=Nocardioides sp. TRM66260-LWL TaxID=2874478 RepID=UPI001CC471CB|nr:DHA2 family efflux MFS transporter permease subunit [Nocardioides sp. TRM66260-LWL]MBZ5734278.1 DHA2 family efflux MFS transporter permease subunit [Nocardioides sp. TRM66260-LWL]